MVRHKNRYIVVQINPQEASKDGVLNLNSTLIYKAVMTKLQQLHGDFGVAAIRTGLLAKYCNARTRIAIIKCRHGPHRLIASCLPCVDNIDDKWVNLTTLYTGATLRQCFKFVLAYQQDKVEQLCASARSEEEKVSIAEDLLNMSTVAEMN